MYEIIKIKDGVIESHSIVNRHLRENEIIVNNWSGTIGEPLTFYDENYKRYTDIELINKGLKEPPKGMKIEDDKLIEMTLQEKVDSGFIVLEPNQKLVDNQIVEKSQVERINEGLEDLPKGFEIIDGELKLKSIQKQLEDGDISQEEFNQIRVNELKQFLFETDYISIKIAEGEATKEEYADILQQRREARNKINELE